MVKSTAETEDGTLTHKLGGSSGIKRLLLAVILLSIICGAATGFLLSNKSTISSPAPVTKQAIKTAQEDTKVFRDFAEGTIHPRPAPKDPSEYVEGTHLLQRVGASPVALTSSVVDLTKYEGKKVKVFGETQKAIKEGWLMDVGKVEEL